jgi:disulfide oxidoreductase YuzD
VIKSISTHIKRNFPKKEFYPKLVKYISEIADPESLAEPDLESELKPMMKEALQRLGYKVHPTEIKIEPRTRADMVGYKRRYETEEKGLFLKKTIKKPWYEFVGVELKTAKRDRDSAYRQALAYINYFDYTFIVLTPYTLITWGYETVKDVYKFMKSKGVGIVLVDKHNPIGTILEAKEKKPKERNRKYLCQTIVK